MTSPTDSFPGKPRGIDELARLAAAVDAGIPDRYRREAFRALARHVLVGGDVTQGLTGSEIAGETHSPTGPGAARSAAPPDVRAWLGEHARLLSSPGRVLLKALIALQAVAAPGGIEWLTPAEIERLLRMHAGTAAPYRTNLSNALRASRGLVERRRRHRGFEYRITALGQETLERELHRLRW